MIAPSAGTQRITHRSVDRLRTVVIGGGLAGLAAAVRLADAGREVTLLEARPRLGGATASFRRETPAGALEVDTGQHVALRCYQRYLALLDRFGTASGMTIQDRLDIPVILSGGRRTRLRRSRRLAAPGHLAPTLLSYPGLSVTERRRAGRAALALRTLDPDDPGLDEETFGDWLRRTGQSERSVRRLWGLISTAALNTHPDRASLALAVRVLRTGLLDEASAGDLAVPAVPLSELHGVAAGQLLAGLGVEVHCGVRVSEIRNEAGGFRVRTAGARREQECLSDEVVLAVPHHNAAALVPPEACPDRTKWAALGSSAIMNCHLVLDRQVLDLPFAALPDSAAQWVFDRTAVAGLPQGQTQRQGQGQTQYLVTSLSDADTQLERRAADVITGQLDALRDVLPDLAQARVLDAFVTREPRATFDQRAGSAAGRPAASTRLPGLTLAGAWTATGWPDTMEGAVRSGEVAADQLLGRLVDRRPITQRSINLRRKQEDRTADLTEVVA